ncbi:MAG: protein kinase, partial [Planctomycetota bacterium]
DGGAATDRQARAEAEARTKAEAQSPGAVIAVTPPTLPRAQQFLDEERPSAASPVSLTMGAFEPRPGMHVGPYEILSTIGQGAMGVVYLARHGRLGNRVALKVLAGARYAADPALCQRLLREARIGARLRHPNICRILDMDEVADGMYIAMEYLEGDTASKLARERGKLPVPEVCAYMCAAVSALKYLAAEHIVHRDVKPSNLMICRDGTVKLLDLGLAKDLGATATPLTGTNVGMGSPGYMAPEQFTDARGVGPPADLFGAGATLFHLLTGEKPFAGDNFMQVALKTQEARPRNPRELRPEIPVPLAELVLKLLAKEPQARPQHDEVLKVLGSCLSGAPVAEAQVALTMLGSKTMAAHFEHVREQIREGPLEVAERLPKKDGQPSLGNYILGARLGPAGGIEAFHATHCVSGVQVVARILPPVFAQMGKEKLEALLKAQGELIRLSGRSPNLVSLMEVSKERLTGGASGAVFYVIEDFVKGRSLQEMIKSGERLAPDIACAWLRQAARGLSVLHKNGFVHGNLHAGKFFFDEALKQVCLTDLSRAHPVGQAAAQTEAPHTIAAIRDVNWMGEDRREHRQYLAPEVLGENAPPAGIKTEQYALGVVFLEALTGKPLRTAPSDFELLRLVVMDMQSRLLEVQKRAGPLGLALQRMLLFDPDQRFPSLRDLRQELHGQSQGQRPAGVVSERPRKENQDGAEPMGADTQLPGQQVFISHANEDSDVAVSIAKGLEEAGFTTWYYERNSNIGHRHPEQTGKAIEQSEAMLLLVSKHSIRSRPVTRELLRADHSGKPFLPVLLDMSHDKLEAEQPESWRDILLDVVDVSIGREDVHTVLPRIIRGLDDLGVLPGQP